MSRPSRAISPPTASRRRKDIVGGVLLALGIFTRPLCAWFGLQILVGIVSIYAKAGWFVVGAGRNRMEYRVLILVCLLVASLTAVAAPRVSRKPADLAAA